MRVVGTYVIRGDARSLPLAAGLQVDAIVTDPPAGISFMGRQWDHDHGGRDGWVRAFAAIFAEASRYLKPGGHAFVWALPRTSHWTATALEDAGFEIRDVVVHLFGSGFPKSLDVGKAIDRLGPNQTYIPFPEFSAHYAERRKAAGMTHAQVCALGGFFGTVNHGGTSVNWEKGFALPTAAQWEVVAPALGLDAKWRTRVVREEYEREVVGYREVHRGLAFTSDGPNHLPVTAPACEASAEWTGWGTALKPASEHWILGRKPLSEPTVAANVLAHGVGGLNVDGCRVEVGGEVLTGGTGRNGKHAGWDRPWMHDGSEHEAYRSTAGRWPANVTLDPDAAELLDEQSGTLTSGGTPEQRHADKFRTAYGDFSGGEAENGIGSRVGGASRFYYVAKPSPSERNAGLPHGMPNDHPTVKAIALMRWLCRLVTPPGGTVLDCFTGSGTTGCAAVLEGFNFIGVEQDAHYCDLACRRIAYWAAQGRQIDMFAELPA